MMEVNEAHARKDAYEHDQYKERKGDLMKESQTEKRKETPKETKKNPPTDTRITARVTIAERERIAARAGRCGLSVSEYIKQRALGYEPQAALPDAFFHFCEQIDWLVEASASYDVERAALELLAEMNRVLIAPGKERDGPWRPPASGPSGAD